MISSISIVYLLFTVCEHPASIAAATIVSSAGQ
jgi:hypothetical protein